MVRTRWVPPSPSNGLAYRYRRQRTEDTSPDPSSYCTTNGMPPFQKYENQEENDDHDEESRFTEEDIEGQSDAYSLPYSLKISSFTNEDACTTATEEKTVVVNNKKNRQARMAPSRKTIWEEDKDSAEDDDDLWDGVVEACNNAEAINDVTFSSIANRNATLAAISNMTKTTDDAAAAAADLDDASCSSECDKTALADESMEVEVEVDDYYEVVCLDKKLKQARRVRKRSVAALVCVLLVGIIVAIVCGTMIPPKKQRNDEPQTHVSEVKGEDQGADETTTTSGEESGGVMGEQDETVENVEKDENGTTTSGKEPGGGVEGEEDENVDQDLIVEQVEQVSEDDPLIPPPSPPPIASGEDESDFDLPQPSPSFSPSFSSLSFSSSSPSSVSSSPSSSFSSLPSSSPVPESTFEWNVNDNTNDNDNNNNQEDVVDPQVVDNVFADGLGGGLGVFPIALMNHEDTIDSAQPKVLSNAHVCVQVHSTGNLGVYHGGCATTTSGATRRRTLLTTPTITTIFETKCVGNDNSSTGNYYAKLQGDGNLFVFPGTSRTGRTGPRLWKSKIVGASTKDWFLALNQDFTLSIYEGTGPLDKGPELWSSSMGIYECYGQEL